MHTHTYIYIYIERYGERERERDSHPRPGRPPPAERGFLGNVKRMRKQRFRFQRKLRKSKHMLHNLFECSDSS